MATKTKRRKLNLGRIKKLSTLLAIGLRDLRKHEETDGCKVDMDVWLKSNGRCTACMAGSVLRWSCGFDEKCKLRLLSDVDKRFDKPMVSRLLAINLLRQGLVESAAGYIGVGSNVKNRYVESYSRDRYQWWADMKQLLADLKAAGE